MNQFSCGTVTQRDGPTVVWAAGDVDLAVAARLGAEIDPRLVPGASVILDCAGVTFCDSFGLGVLVHAARQAEDVGADLVLAGVPEAVRTVLELTGLVEHFRVFQDVESAKEHGLDR